MSDLRAPFPYFGGKSKVAPLVWQRFGKVVNLIEPFFGSGAVTLACPEDQRPKIETVNDWSMFVCNFWRAVGCDAEAVARECDHPVMEADIHARHLWLLQWGRENRERMMTDPNFYDARAAGWWVHGASAWIGTGYCVEDGNTDTPSRQVRHLTTGGVGVASLSMRLPHRGAGTGGTGDNKHACAHFGKGIHGAGMREPSRQIPECATGGRGIHSATARSALWDLFAALQQRLRYTRVTCGDWSRICTPAVTWRHGLTAVFLDPEYDGFEYVYGDKDEQKAVPLSARVREWCLENGARPDLRIVLAGYAGEHDALEAAGWEVVPWKARGGYGNQSNGANNNAERERLWASPHCLKPGRDVGQLDIFAARGAQ